LEKILKKWDLKNFFLVWKNFCGKIWEISDRIFAERDKAEKLLLREKRKEEAAKAPARGGAAVARGGRTPGPGIRVSEPGESETSGENAPSNTPEGEGRGGGVRRGGPAARRGGGRGRGGNVEDQDVVNSLFAKMQATNVYKDRRNN
jgi:hypothetical protein